MDSYDVLKKLIVVVVALGVIVFGIGSFWTESILFWFFGILLGTGISVIKVIMLNNTLNKAVEMSPEDAKNYTRSRYTFRLVLSIVMVVVAVKIPYISVVGVIVGLLLVQPAVYIVNFLNKGQK